MANSQTTVGAIEAIENGFDVNSLVYRNIRVWPWLRAALIFYFGGNRGPLASKVQKKLATSPYLMADAANPPESGFHKDSRADEFIKASVDWKPLDAFKQADILFFGSGNTRRVVVDNRQLDTQLDPIISIAASNWSWLKLSGVKGRADNADAPFLPEHRFKIQPFLRRIDAIKRVHLDPDLDTIRGWSDFVRSFPKLVGTPLREPDSTHAAAVFELQMIDAARLVFGAVLERVQPKLTIFVGQNVTTFGLAHACYEKGIACADIQHGAGALSPANIKWFGWRNIPAGGYEFLPDFFWVYGQSAADRIQNTMSGAMDRHVPIVGTNVWLQWCQSLPWDPMQLPASDFRVLVTLPQLSVEPFPEHLFEAIVRSPKNWLWMIRLHPLDLVKLESAKSLREAFQARGISNVEIDISSTAALPRLVAAVHRHVTLYSSSYLEAAALGLPTVFAHEKARDFFPEICLNSDCAVATTADDLLMALQRHMAVSHPLMASDLSVGKNALLQMLRLGPRREQPAKAARK